MQVSHSKQASISIVYTNCPSIYHKLDELRTLVSQHSPHVICLCETWLDDSILDDELFIPSFNLVRRDRSRHGGGIALYIHNSIPFKVLLTHSHIELLITERTLQSCNLVCAHPHHQMVLSLLEDSLDGLLPSKFYAALTAKDSEAFKQALWISAVVVASVCVVSLLKLSHD